MEEVGVDKSFEKQDIKTDSITENQYDFLRSKVKKAEDLFNKRARKFRELNLGNNPLTEKMIRDLILKEYTFLKRPVFIIGDAVYTGNAPKTVKEISKRLHE